MQHLLLEVRKHLKAIDFVFNGPCFLFCYYYVEASRGAVGQSVTVKLTVCGFNPHSRRCNVYLNLYFHFFALVSRQSSALSFASQHAMPPESGRKWGAECLNTRFPLPTMLCAGYSVKPIFFSQSGNRTFNRCVYSQTLPLCITSVSMTLI